MKSQNIKFIWCVILVMDSERSMVVGKERNMRILINVKFGQRRGHFILLEDDMARDTKTFRDRIPTSIPFVFNSIPQETANMRS